QTVSSSTAHDERPRRSDPRFPRDLPPAAPRTRRLAQNCSRKAPQSAQGPAAPPPREAARPLGVLYSEPSEPSTNSPRGVVLHRDNGRKQGKVTVGFRKR